MGLTRTKQSHESMISGDGSGRCWVDNPITYFHICENHKNKIANFFKLMLGPVGPVSVLAARKATLGIALTQFVQGSKLTYHVKYNYSQNLI